MKFNQFQFLPFLGKEFLIIRGFQLAYKNVQKTKRLILLLLKDMGQATTEELINEADALGIAECRDRVPSAIADLKDDGKINKTLSREKKAIIWSLNESVNQDLLE